MYKIFLICFLVSCASVTSSIITFRNDYKLYEEVSGWVKLHTVPATWQDARLHCLDEGASLASAYNMRKIIASLMAAEGADHGIGIYSGMSSTEITGPSLTIAGVPISDLPANWVTGQLEQVHMCMENCVVFNMNGTLQGVQCDDKFQYICYKKFEPVTINKCNTVDNEYTWDDRTGHCYKFHWLGQPWAKAYTICTAEGGYLAIINSDTEAEVLKEMFAKYPAASIYSNNTLVAAIGFREWPKEGWWYTIQGQTLQEAGYAKWSPGEPNNAVLDGEVQDCGAIYRSALLDDMWCSQAIAFICEINP